MIIKEMFYIPIKLKHGHQVFSQLKWQGNKNYLAHFVKLKDIRTIAYPFSAMRQTKGHRNNDTPLNRFDVFHENFTI
jgi:hypothetical protein